MFLPAKAACVLCMLSPAGRETIGLERLKQEVDTVVSKYFFAHFIAHQPVVDLAYHELSGQDRVTRHVILEGLRDGGYAALVLVGDVLTEFGVTAQLTARQASVPVRVVGFGSGPFGRMCRKWYRKRDTPSSETMAAVEEAERLGLHIC